MDGGWAGKVRQWRNLVNPGNEVGNGGRQQKQLNSETPRDLKTPRTLELILPAVCEKNVFRFFRSSASGKPHFISMGYTYVTLLWG